MKKLIISIGLLLSALGVSAQNRKNFSNFPLLQQYYNPSLTGFGGSVLKTIYRDQWTGFEGAPRTISFSAEMGAKELSAWAQGVRTETLNGAETSAHAWGLYAMHDSFGAFADSRVGVTYGSRVRLSEKVSLRAGAAITYSLQRLRNHELVLDNENDSELAAYSGQNGRASTFDLDLGLTLTGENFYLGYGIQDVTGGYLASGDGFLKDTYTAQHTVQAGARKPFSESVGIVVNGLYRYDRNDKGTAEGQAKLVFRNMMWVGAGYRQDLAYIASAGFGMGKFRLSYAYETTTGKAQYMTRPSNEVSVSYNLFGQGEANNGKLTIW